MRLILLAHRGEAQEFIKHLPVKADPNFNGFYLGEDVSVLISGEGIYQVMTKLPYLFAKYNIQSVVNFGIAGALDKELELKAIYPVQTCYAYNEKGPKFHSFTTQSTQANLDCVTTEQRVLTDDYANLIRPFAQIVDRELWAIGACCQEYKVPFQSYKLISDYAGAATSCFDIKKMAQEYSEALYNEYLSLEDQNDEIEEQINFPLSFSFSHKIQYKKLIQALTLREGKTVDEILTEVNFHEVQQMESRPKDQAKELIYRLDKKLNPLRVEINRKLHKEFSEFNKIGAKVKIDPKLETQKFVISMEINSKRNLTNLKEAIENFNFSNIEKIWNGEVDV